MMLPIASSSHLWARWNLRLLGVGIHSGMRIGASASRLARRNAVVIAGPRRPASAERSVEKRVWPTMRRVRKLPYWK